MIDIRQSSWTHRIFWVFYAFILTAVIFFALGEWVATNSFKYPVPEWSTDFRAAPEDRWLVVQFELDARFDGELNYRTIDAFRIGDMWFLSHGDFDYPMTPVNLRVLKWTYR